jgi:prepilin-type N-terminal cleavage/methylation domain-containing protein
MGMYMATAKRMMKKKGFTLVETLVAVGLFSIVTTIAMSAFLAMVNANYVSRNVRIATDNLNLALEDMSRRIKTGTVYGCDPVGVSAAENGTRDCGAGAGSIAFTDQDGVRTMYKVGLGSGDSNGDPAGCGSNLYETTRYCILRFREGKWIPVTSHEIQITRLRFIVRGSSGPPDSVQPYVIVFIQGTLGVPPKPVTSFKIQTMITQRQLDL